MLTASEDIAFVCADATLQHWVLHQCRAVLPSMVKIEPFPFMPSGLINSNNQLYWWLPQSSVCEPRRGLNGAAGIPADGSVRSGNDEKESALRRGGDEKKTDAFGRVYVFQGFRQLSLQFRMSLHGHLSLRRRANFSQCCSTSIGEPGGSLKGFGVGESEIVQIILFLFRRVILDSSCFFL